MKRVFIYCMALMVTGSACKKNESESTLPAQELLNVSYGADAQQKMDIYLPAGRSTTATKALILIHGGAWVSGDKAEMNDAINTFKTLLPDYAFFNINYRLATTGGNLWPTQLNDVDAAVNFIINRSSEYKFNDKLMAIGGASAGAHLALLQAYKSNNGNFKAAVDLFGPTDMKDLYNFSPANTKFVLELFMGGSPSANPTGYTNASPLFAVSSSSIPTIILHGTLDNIVPLHQSDSLNNRLAASGVTKQYEKYTGEGHGIWSTANTIDAFTKIAAFLKLHVK